MTTKRGDIKLMIDQLNGVFPYYVPVIESAVTMLETLGNKVAEQERRIEYLESSEEMFRAERLEHEKVIESLSTLNGIDEYKKDVRDRAKAARKEHDASIRQTLVGIGILTDEVGYLTCGNDKDQLSLVGEIIFSGTSVKLAEQAAVIEKISEKLKPYPKLAHNTGYFHLQEFFEEILATPTDSKQILADWMREQLGEPAAVVVDDFGGWTKVHMYEAMCDGTKLFKLPDCLK